MILSLAALFALGVAAGSVLATYVLCYKLNKLEYDDDANE